VYLKEKSLCLLQKSAMQFCSAVHFNAHFVSLGPMIRPSKVAGRVFQQRALPSKVNLQPPSLPGKQAPASSNKTKSYLHERATGSTLKVAYSDSRKWRFPGTSPPKKKILKIINLGYKVNHVSKIELSISYITDKCSAKTCHWCVSMYPSETEER